jgi:hypothetical protein
VVFGVVMPQREQTISTLPSSNKVIRMAAIPAACSGILANTSGNRAASPSLTKAAYKMVSRLEIPMRLEWLQLESS